MSFGKDSDPVAGLKKFVSEDELDEARKKRQEEWEKVRKPEDPEEAPEEAVDTRSLFDKLQEQKLAKEDEYAEKHRLSNQVRGLHGDEAQFLELVDEKQLEITRRREAEESEVLAELHSHKTAEVAPPVSSSSKQPARPVPPAMKKSQQALLAGAVKRKSTDVESNVDVKKSKPDDLAQEASPPEGARVPQGGSTAQVIGVLPGLGVYDNSSDSEVSTSDSEIDLPPNLYESRKIIMSHTHEGCS